MKCTPKTEKQIAEANLWAKGDYAFEIISAEETVSNSGNDVIKMKVKIFKDDGKSQTLFDYLMDNNSFAFKLRHFAEVCGLLKDYEQGELQAFSLVGKTGYCKVGVSVDKSGQYPDKNSISDYLTEKPANAKNLDEVVKGDDIPW